MERRIDTRLSRLARRIQAWRRSRTRFTPMPAPLWAEAVSLARLRGVASVAKALDLDYTSLKQRLQRSPASSPPPGFVELKGSQLLGLAPVRPAETVVELRAPDGALLTLRLAPGTPLDVASLVQSFRGGEP